MDSAEKGSAGNLEELFLLRLRYKEGRSQKVEGNTPVLLTEPDTLWVVYAGRLDVFAVPRQDGEATGRRVHLLRAQAGQAVFGMDAGPDLALIGVGEPGTEVVKLPASRLDNLIKTPAHAADGVALVDGWIETLSAAVVEGVPPKDCAAVEPGASGLEKKGPVRARRGTVWLRHSGGSAAFLSRRDRPGIGENVWFPLTRRTWIDWSGDGTGDGKMETRGTAGILAEKPVGEALGPFHELALDCVREKHLLTLEAEAAQFRERRKAGQAILSSALHRVAAVMDSETEGDGLADPGSDPLLAACRLVGDALGVEIQAPPGRLSHRTDPVAAVARASRLRVRPVLLSDGWWKQDSGPLLGYSAETGHPLALIPSSPGRYVAHDPVLGTRMPVTDAAARTIASEGYRFYRSLPARSLTFSDLVRFGMWGRGRDLLSILVTGVAGAVLGLLTPIAVGLLMGTVIPSGERPLLTQLGLALVAAALATACFEYARGIGMLRVQAAITAPIQAAVWDRLLSLPTRFFRGYSAGDLADRALSIQGIGRLLSGLTATAILSALFSLFGFGLMFYYHPGLAGLAVLLTGAVLGVTVWIGAKELRGQRELSRLDGEISGVLFQLLTGVAKLQAAGMERSAFKMWAERFVEQRRIAFHVRTLGNRLAAFSSAVPLVTGVVLFAAVAGRGAADVPPAVFLAFHAAFGQVLAGILALNAMITSVVAIIPMAERVKPILKAVPEEDPGRKDPGELRGGIELAQVWFRYKPDDPYVLSDVSLRAEPGEFVAIVGPSGSGKSTLLRLLLGFETPERGAVYYDGQDLSRLDLAAVRHQIGVVLQHTQLMPGDIFRNIVGAAPLTMDDAWEAARLVGLDEDIRRMPMGMHTVVSEGGRTFSGGQRQRLLIARAIAGKPRILLLDEATSALDNRSQEHVRKSLDSLQATRIVIAHRLSTIVHADRIYVLQAGRVVQVGTYEQLIKEGGLFGALARRQVV